MSIESDAGSRMDNERDSTAGKEADSTRQDFSQEYSSQTQQRPQADSSAGRTAASTDKYLGSLEITGLDSKTTDRQGGGTKSASASSDTVNDATGSGRAGSNKLNRTEQVLRDSRELLAQLEAPGMVHSLKNGRNINESVNDPKHAGYRDELLQETKKQYDEARAKDPAAHPELKFKEDAGGKISQITQESRLSHRLDKNLYTAPNSSAHSDSTTQGGSQNSTQTGAGASSGKSAGSSNTGNDSGKRPRLGKPTGVSAQDWLEIEPFVSQ